MSYLCAALIFAFCVLPFDLTRLYGLVAVTHVTRLAVTWVWLEAPMMSLSEMDVCGNQGGAKLVRAVKRRSK